MATGVNRERMSVNKIILAAFPQQFAEGQGAVRQREPALEPVVWLVQIAASKKVMTAGRVVGIAVFA